MTRIRRAHQVTAGGLYLCLERDYTEYREKEEEESQVMSMEDCRTVKDAPCPNLKFWPIILQLEWKV